jgi:UBX domain
MDNAPAPTAPPAGPSSTAAAAAAAAEDSSSDGLTMSASDVQTMYASRRERLEADKAAKETAESAERKTRTEARRNSQSGQAAQARKGQAEAKAERERILQKIENDKLARRERERERQQHRREMSTSSTNTGTAANATNAGKTGHASRESTGSASSLGKSTIKECALQVRLFDGSTIRQRFSAWKTLRTHVRPWIERERKGDDAPFTLRQVLVPLPNRVIEISEEDQDLESLGLCPSATLIMVPVQGYTNAYDTPGNYVAKGVSSGYSIVSEGVGLLGSAIGALFGYGDEARETGPTVGTARASAEDRPRRVGGDGDDPQHLYTGNGINVEPRRELKREDSWG